MMEEVNFNTVLLDLPSGGVDRTRPEDVMTIANYSKPLTDYLASINFTVLLVGHDLGGAAVSYAMEMYPDKIEKAIFIQAVMPKDGETPGLLINGYKILAMKLLTDSPYSILNEVMHLTKENYGSVKRFYITTNMDRFFPSEVQKHIYTQNPPKAKFVLKNGDHASFFSEAPYLFNMLRTIANSQW
ncbi:hypothetical protein R1sor_011778 [Riccia sorocarpa]|uniref:AB hydrolase-1 domain-containing protein n=1 Tax=Riccia sorocarpa TaxID=122646 RepID=A0ABD3I4J8_9MARC